MLFCFPFSEGVSALTNNGAEAPSSVAGDRQAEMSFSGALLLPKLQYAWARTTAVTCSIFKLVMMLRKTPGSPDALFEAVKHPLFTY